MIEHRAALHETALEWVLGHEQMGVEIDKVKAA